MPVTSSSLRSFQSRDVATTRPETFLHITGEVTNPTLLENFVVEHPLVKSAIMFGHGRYNAGLVIDLKDGFKIDPSDDNQLGEMRNKLQSVIDRMNMFAPQHARIQKEMILFSAPTKPFIYTPPGSARVNRRDTLATYSIEINTLYKNVAQAAQISLNPPTVWSPKNALSFVRGIIVSVLGRKLADDVDLFDHGVDSLQVTRIRIILFHALRTTAKLDTRKLSGNIVCQYPTIASLAGFATRTAMACFRHRTESSQARCLEMTEMVRKFIVGFPVHSPSMAQPPKDVVLITGTTGLFGSHLLAQFLQCPDVGKVYALNRKKSRPCSTVEKQASLLQACGLDPALARHPKLTLLDADASRSQLGLPREVYELLLSSVTHIVHNAWLSTFDDNLSLGIFEGSFHMLRNLVDFALSSPFATPPRLLFISSTDTLRGSNTFESASDKFGPTACPISACDAAGNLYGESKWVGEQILAVAASETPLRPTIVRIGPLSGAVNGRWRDDALLPTIVQLSVTLGALPKIDERVCWIPVDVAARAVLDIRTSSSLDVHVVHPHPVSSLALLRRLGGMLGLPLISLSQWTARLADDVYAIPATTNRHKHGPADAALVVLRRIHGTKDSTTFDDDRTRIFDHVQVRLDKSRPWFGSGSVPSLGIEDVGRWVRYWREVGIVSRFSMLRASSSCR